MDVDLWDDDYEDDLDYECDGCGRTSMDDGWCPMCCPNGGSYAPGTEDCEICDYYQVCAR